MSDFSSLLKVTRTTTRSQRQEKSLAEGHGGRVTPGSGNGLYQKGDVHTRTELIEAKTTRLASYTLRLGDLKKNLLFALKAGKRALFVIQFETDGPGSSWVVMPHDDYLALKDRL